MSILSNISKNTNTGQSLPSSLVTITPVCPLTYMRRGGLCSACPPWGTACCCTPDRIWSPQSPGPLTSSHPAAINMPPPGPGPAAACLCLFLSCCWLTACNMTGKCQNGDDKNSDCLLPDQESCSSRKLSFTVPDAWRYKFQTSVLICRIYCNLLLFLAWILTGATSVFNSCAH